jgi:multicomponent Na+:H+ antiporter subunit G
LPPSLFLNTGKQGGWIEGDFVDIRTIITGILLALGCFFIMVASIGIVRFPDFYSRMHPAGKSDTLGQMLILLGLMVYEGLSLVSVKLFIIIVFIFIVNPTATHALAKAAYLSGVKPWEKTERDSK